MRSAPPVQLALVLLGFMALAWPLIRLTSSSSAVAMVVPVVVAVGHTSCHLRVSYAHQPTELSVALGEQVLTGSPEPGGVTELTVDLPVGKDGLELSLSAHWPAGTPRTAVTVDVEPDGLDSQSQTRWTDQASMAEVLLFTWPQ
jgi:hypothetical protein